MLMWHQVAEPSGPLIHPASVSERKSQGPHRRPHRCRRSVVDTATAATVPLYIYMLHGACAFTVELGVALAGKKELTSELPYSGHEAKPAKSLTRKTRLRACSVVL